MLVIAGTSKDAHSLRSQVGIGSESDCLFGQFDRILWISDSEAGGKDEKSTGIAVGDSECGEDVTELESGSTLKAIFKQPRAAGSFPMSCLAAVCYLLISCISQ